jgi:CBS domain containing-hemolysin-like protein
MRHKIKGADILADFLAKPDLLLGTTLVGTNIMNTVFSIVAVAVAVRMIGPSGSWLASAIVTVIILVAGEYLPKAWFQSFPSRRCLPFATTLRFFGRILYPISYVLMYVVRLLTPFLSKSEGASNPPLTRDEVMHLVEEGRKSGALSNDEVRMITGVFDLRTMTCDEVMVPRKDMVYIHQDTAYDDIIMFARAQHINQFPVFDRTKKTFVGIVYIFDLLADSAPGSKTASDYMRPPQLVSVSTPVDHILPRMRVTRQPMVLVINHKSEVVGYVYLDHVLEEIVGH